MRVLKSNNKKLYNIIQNYSESEKIVINNSTDSEIEYVIKDLENNINIYVEKAKSGDYTIRVEAKDNDLYFHSKYNPTREAKKKIEKFKAKEKKQIFALGFGLGYSLNELACKNKYDRIIIIEPFMSIFYTALNFIDLSELLKSNNIVYVIGSTNSLFDVVRKYFSLTLEKELSFFEHNPSHKLFEAEYKKIYKQLREVISFKKINLTTNINSARKWRNNLIANLPYIFKSPKADDFFNEFKDIPAICVSAGPSLDKNINDIKKAEGKAIIMCVGTSLKPLLKNGIEPDIVVSMDGNKANFEHFKDINNIPDSYLFAEKANHYMIQQKWHDKQVFFTMKRNFSGWVESLKGDYTPIQTGGTVAHSMVDLAYKMGANPIILAGQDLAYSEGKTHASGTTYENQQSNNKNLIEIDGINGDKVLTSKAFMTMLSYFNNYFDKHSDRKYIDATEGGAKINNTEIKTMEVTIEEFCNQDFNINIKELLKNKFKKVKPKFTQDKLEKAIEDLLQELDQAIGLSNEQLSLIKKMENKVKHANILADIQSDKFKTKLKTLENQIKSLKNVKYCTERILIIESMKYKEVKSKYYISEIKKFNEEIKYYRSYRVQYIEELKKCRNLIRNLYTVTKKVEGLEC
jgi:hypothetical protein